MIIEIFLAVIPVIIITTYVYKMDVIKKEPKLLLGKLFLGGIISVFIAMLIKLLMRTISIEIFYASDIISKFIYCFGIVAFSEEISKFAILRFFSFNDKNFKNIFDGIVYSVFVSLGFACLENITYVLNNDIFVAIARAFMAVPAHAFFGTIMGFYYSYYKINYKEKKNNKFLFLSIFIPILLHGCYDFLIYLNNYVANTLLLIFILVMYFKFFDVVTNTNENKTKIKS